MKRSAPTGRNPHGQFEWHRRRRLIYATLAFNLVSGIALLVAGLLGMDSTLLTTLTVSNYSLAGAVIGSYVFGAVWDDKNARDTWGVSPPIEQPTLPEDFAG
jgi:hypothetical protein